MFKDGVEGKFETLIITNMKTIHTDIEKVRKIYKRMKKFNIKLYIVDMYEQKIIQKM